MPARAVLAAEAADMVSGADAFWRIQDWLCEHRGEFADDRLRQVAQELGFDVPAHAD